MFKRENVPVIYIITYRLKGMHANDHAIILCSLLIPRLNFKALIATATLFQ